MSETVWEFATERFHVSLEIDPEYLDPADSFQFEEDIEAVRNGDVEWFAASVIVRLDGNEVGRDSLGACAYHSVREFYTSHRDRDPLNRNSSIMREARGGNVIICHDFPSMVAEATHYARETVKRLQTVHLRA